VPPIANAIVLTVMDPVWPAEGRSHGSLKMNTCERIEGFRTVANVVDTGKHFDPKRHHQRHLWTDETALMKIWERNLA